MAAWCAENLRNCEGWRACGLPMSTTSDESCRLFDGLLRQMISWSDCDQLGGIHHTMHAMIDADPKAVLPRAFKLGLEGLGTAKSARTNIKFNSDLEALVADAKSYGTDRERKHAEAVKLWGHGYFRAATNLWEDILVDFPTDMMAVKFAHDAYFFMGDGQGKRDSAQRVIVKWKGTEPCYSYLHGMLAFGLEECEQYVEAEKEAVKALTMHRFDSWATHAYAHCMVMNGRMAEGAQFMEQTVDNWRPGWIIATHNYWHFALFYVEQADYESALSIFDEEVCKRSNTTLSVLDYVDAASLLWRLELEGVNVGDRWNDLPSMSTHLNDHCTGFNDTHLGPSFLRKGETDNEKKIYSSLKEYTAGDYGDNARVAKKVGLALYEGMTAFANENFDEAAEKILPVRNEIYSIGGSNAQRDIYTQTLIHACMRSKNPENFAMTRTILEERNSLCSNSPLAVRLAEKYRIAHI